ncbi:hypothetical protein, partial [Ewingella americana]|uniref:hypothetical protein n=1 Tax=Ewingella americana TaxID=41202 RepID=UPI001B3108B2
SLPSPLRGDGANPKNHLKRHGVNASRSRSEVTPNEWFETKGSKPEIREPPKRRHFATITAATETRPFHPCAASIFQQQKNAGFQRVSFKTLWASVGGEPTVLTLRPVWRQRTVLTLRVATPSVP